MYIVGRHKRNRKGRYIGRNSHISGFLIRIVIQTMRLISHLQFKEMQGWLIILLPVVLRTYPYQPVYSAEEQFSCIRTLPIGIIRELRHIQIGTSIIMEKLITRIVFSQPFISTQPDTAVRIFENTMNHVVLYTVNSAILSYLSRGL